MKILFAHRSRIQPWGIALVAVLVIGYFNLTSGAIYCQYLFQDNEEHHGTASHPVSSRMHCLMANHGSITATHSAESTRFNPLQFLTLVFSRAPVSTGSGDVIADTARAPPPAVSTIV